MAVTARMSKEPLTKRTSSHTTEPIVRRMLTVGRADDSSERAADVMADLVMRRLRGGSAQEPLFGTATSRVRRASWAPNNSGGQRSEPIGPEGGTVDATTSQLIERASGHGGGLPMGVRRPMEEAFGSDFSDVRVHADRAAHHANDRLGARAFTTGNDIFFSKDAYQPTSAPGQRLLAHELSHVVQHSGQTTASRQIRRVVTSGTDPKTLINPMDKDLLYGINIPRGQTKGRLDPNQRDAIRTIDDYNRSIGINAIMTSMNSAMGLYDVREQLGHNGPWGFPKDPALNTPTNANAINQWIDYLRQHAAHIGLEDLGGKGGTFSKAKIDKGGRFKKNRAESQANQPKNDRLTPADTRRFLAAANTKPAALLMYNAMSAPKQTALNKWIYRAFFRRTSKLGQDFTIKVLNARVHFNTVADPNYQPLLGPQWIDGGLEQMANTGQNDKNRSITVSELRHMRKLAAQYPARFNVYGEI